MAKQRHQETDPPSSRNALIVMAVGIVLVTGLVGWALTRTVETPRTVVQEQSTSELPPMTNPALGTAATPVTNTSVTPPPPQVHGDRADVRRIAAEDLRTQFNRGEVTIIDVRDKNAYQNGHIPGSLNIPFASVQTMIDTIPKGKPIVTYCT